MNITTDSKRSHTSNCPHSSNANEPLALYKTANYGYGLHCSVCLTKKIEKRLSFKDNEAEAAAASVIFSDHGAKLAAINTVLPRWAALYNPKRDLADKLAAVVNAWVKRSGDPSLVIRWPQPEPGPVHRMTLGEKKRRRAAHIATRKQARAQRQQHASIAALQSAYIGS